MPIFCLNDGSNIKSLTKTIENYNLSFSWCHCCGEGFIWLKINNEWIYLFSFIYNEINNNFEILIFSNGA